MIFTFIILFSVIKNSVRNIPIYIYVFICDRVFEKMVKYLHFATVDIEILVLRFLVASPSVEF